MRESLPQWRIRGDDGEPLELLDTGRNSLYGLIYGFTALANACEGVLSRRDEDEFKRPRDQFPQWRQRPTWACSPFRTM